MVGLWGGGGDFPLREEIAPPYSIIHGCHNDHFVRFCLSLGRNDVCECDGSVRFLGSIFVWVNSDPVFQLAHRHDFIGELHSEVVVSDEEDTPLLHGS